MASTSATSSQHNSTTLYSEQIFQLNICSDHIYLQNGSDYNQGPLHPAVQIIIICCISIPYPG